MSRGLQRCTLRRSELYKGWEIGSRKSPTSAESCQCAIHVVHPLPAFVADMVYLIGDAVHAMTPHQGLGASPGIADAYILCPVAHPRTNTSNLSGVLDIYDSIRRIVSQEVARQSLAYGLGYASLELEYCEALLKVLGVEIIATVGGSLREMGR